MNLRISNLSYLCNTNIVATDSATEFDGVDLFTATDFTRVLVPDENRKIEGTVQFDSDKKLIRLATDIERQIVTVSTAEETRLIVPLHGNIAIEWDNDITDISAF